MPSSGNRFRGAIASDVDRTDFAVDAPSDLPPTILGGRTELKRPLRRAGISLQYTAFGAPPVEKRDTQHGFFRAEGTPRPFPFAELFPTG